jgi:hypothetical protein
MTELWTFVLDTITISVPIPTIRTFFVFSVPCQWPRGLRYEPSSLARTLGSWVRIALEISMSVCVYSVFVLSCE